MRLYKMELYKLCHRKIFMIGAACILGILLFAFYLKISDTESTVDQITYRGYQAIQMDRQITEEFKGALTDEKVEQIIEKYGFPDKREKGRNSFINGNFLNQFVMNYLSNGYMNDYEDYRVGSQIYPIADSDLGAVMELTGKDLILEYFCGWQAFLNVFMLGMILGSILLLFTVSVTFANEGQTKMLPLLFTTKDGRKKDIYAKIGAAFTVAAGIWFGIITIDLLVCGIVYGLDGLHCYNGMVVSYLFPWARRMIPMYYFIIMELLLSLFGLLSLCAITLCFSAYYKNTFHAVAAAAVCWEAPVLAAMFTNGFHGVFKLLSAAPIFLVIYGVIEYIYDIWLILIGIAVIVSILCVYVGYRRYKQWQI